MARTRSSNYRTIIIAVVVSVVIISIVLIAIDRQELISVVGRTEWRMVPAAVAVGLLSYLSLSVSFLVIFRVFGAQVPRRDLLEVGFVSVALSNVVFFGGIPEYSIRVLLIAPLGMSVAGVLAPSVLHSYAKDWVYVFLSPAGVGYLLATGVISGTQATVLAIGTAIFVAAIIALFVGIFLTPVRIWALSVVNSIVKFAAHRDLGRFMDNVNSSMAGGLQEFRKRPLKILTVVGLIFGDYVTALTALWICFRAIGISVGPGDLVIGYTVGRTAGALSFLPGGVGVQAITTAGIFSLLGYPFTASVFGGVLFRLVYYYIPFGISLLFYHRLTTRAIKALEESEKYKQ